MQDLAPRTYFDHIIFLADLQTRSHSALSYARAFTRYFGSHLTLLHAYTAEAVDPLAFPTEKRRLQSLAGEMVQTGLNVDALTRVGAPVTDVLTRTIEGMRPDLIIQGSSGIDDLRRSLRGSIAESVFRTAIAPVLTVGPKVMPYMGRPLQLDRILFVSDFGARVKTTALYALSLAQEFRAHIRLCHVHGQSTAAWSRAQVQKMFEDELNKFIHPEALDWCDPECTVEFGAAAPTIRAMADEYQPDIIVLGAHGLGVLGTHGEPGTAFKIMANAKCPVLTLLSQQRKPDAERKQDQLDLISQC